MAKKTNTNKKEIKGQSKQSKKQNLWVRFRIFCHGVKSEAGKVHWPSKKDMIKYSVATILFVIFCSLFFCGVNVIFALLKTLFN